LQGEARGDKDEAKFDRREEGFDIVFVIAGKAESRR